MDPTSLAGVLRDTADAVGAVLAEQRDWGLAGTRPGQYLPDLAADAAALEVLLGADLGVLSEESGLHEQDRELLAVLDPLDGSTNASLRIPWYATSICVLDEDGPLVAIVRNQATGVTFEARRGGGATRDGVAIAPSTTTSISSSVLALSGYPPAYLGWRQYRALGAVALDLCAVAEGSFDGYVDCARAAHGPWDYLGGALVCSEAGALVVDALGRELDVRSHDERRTPVAAATGELLEELLTARRTSFGSRAQ